jgi:hypothetical protein
MLRIKIMKNINLLIIMLLVFNKFAYSQNLKPDAIVKADHLTYNTKTESTGRYPSISVRNTENVLYGKKNKLGQSTLSYIGKTDNSSLSKIFNSVFTQERIRQLLPESRITIDCYVNPNGKILEVSYFLNKNTILTAKELEKLEEALKSNYTFKLRPEETKGGDFFVITLIVKYSWFFDGTLK